ncbi:hypothetical protein Tsubulata_012801, partial [Turnera subulata]
MAQSSKARPPQVSRTINQNPRTINKNNCETWAHKIASETVMATISPKRETNCKRHNEPKRQLAQANDFSSVQT